MLKTLPKPRWLAWESLCVRLASEQKIQLKVIASALGKSITSISKKIKKLGLREENSKSGRKKGMKNDSKLPEKLTTDVSRMKAILIEYAPLHHLQKNCFTIHSPLFTSENVSTLKNFQIGSPLSLIQQNEAPYTFAPSYDYILADEKHLKDKREKKDLKEPLYVSLCHMEEWAISKGFCKVTDALQKKGISYWKEGKYFSNAQLLSHINGMRFERKLKPLLLYEEEKNIENMKQA